MIFEIKCETCGEVLGTIEKNEITENDIAEYKQMMVCENGHQTILLEEEIND